MDKQYIAICPRCETFYDFKPEQHFIDYWCACRSFYKTIKIKLGLELIDKHQAELPAHTQCKVIERRLT